MKATIDLVISKLLGALPPLANAQSNFYRLQVLILLRVLKAAGVQRIYATQKEIDQLLAQGRLLGHNVSDLMLVVKPATYKTWLRRTNKGEVIKRPGRKGRLPEKIIQLIAKLIKENPAWGLFRIVGELRKLGIRISRIGAPPNQAVTCDTSPATQLYLQLALYN